MKPVHKISLIAIAFISAVAISGGAYLFFHQIAADTNLNSSINSSISISQIPLFSSGSAKTKVDNLEIYSPRGATQSFELLVENKSAQNYSNLTIKKNDLTGASGAVISQSAIDENIIHPWPQKLVDWSASGNTFTASPVTVDELLVKNDHPTLSAPAGKYGGDTFFSNDIGVAQNQLLKSSGYAASEAGEGIKTTLAAGGSKKFYFTVKIPTDKSGDFSGNINFFDKDRGSVVAKFDLRLSVYDFALPSQGNSNLGLLNGCYTNDRILASGSNPPSNISHFFISEDLFKERLTTLKTYGCDGLIMRVGGYADNSAMVRDVSAAGLKGPLILNFYGLDTKGNQDLQDTIDGSASIAKFREILTQIKSLSGLKMPILFYGIDEPNNDALLALQHTKSDNIKKIIGEVFGTELAKSTVLSQVTTSATVATWTNLQADARYHSDYPIENYKSPEVLTGGRAQMAATESYYFQGWNEIQKSNGSYLPINRYLGGLGLLESGFKGAFINPAYGYQGVTYRPIYDDYAATNATSSWQKPMFTFYPASDGFISTLQAESWREGVEDLKYYAAYKQIQASGPSALPTSKKSELQKLAGEIETSVGLYAFKVNDYTLPAGLDSAKMDALRSLINQYLKVYAAPGIGADKTPPVMTDINLTNDQIITTNPYIIKIKASDNTGVSKVEFYIDANLIKTSTLPDSSGVYDAAWDTLKYHCLVKVIAYDGAGNKSEISRSVKVDLAKIAENTAKETAAAEAAAKASRRNNIIKNASSALRTYWPLLIILVIPQIWVIIDILKKKRTKTLSPALWIIIIILGELIGTILYLVFGRYRKKETAPVTFYR